MFSLKPVKINKKVFVFFVHGADTRRCHKSLPKASKGVFTIIISLIKSQCLTLTQCFPVF